MKAPRTGPLQHQLSGERIFGFIALERHVAQSITDQGKKHDDKKKDGDTGRAGGLRMVLFGLEFGIAFTS